MSQTSAPDHNGRRHPGGQADPKTLQKQSFSIIAGDAGATWRSRRARRSSCGLHADAMTGPDPDPTPDRRRPRPGARTSIGRRRRAFGHTADGADVVAAEAAAIQDAAARVLGGQSLSSIVKDWNARGLVTAGGGPWRVNSLSTLLIQRRLAGLGPHGAAGGAGAGPPAILDADTHARLVALHESRAKAGRRPTRRYLLTGLLRCGRCGSGMRGMPRTRGADLYVCPGPPHGGCSGTAVTADKADEVLRGLVLARLDAPELVMTKAGAAAAVALATGRLGAEAASWEVELDALGEKWAAGELSWAQWMALRRPLAALLAAATDGLVRLEALAELGHLVGRGRDLGRHWPSLEPGEQRRIIAAAVERVVVLPAQPPRQQFRPERLDVAWRDPHPVHPGAPPAGPVG